MWKNSLEGNQMYSPVMLSLVLSETNGAAKHLSAHRASPFAALRVTTEENRI